MKTFALLTFSLLAIGFIYPEEQIPIFFEGTYLSEDYLENLQNLKCHITSLKNTLEKGIYEIIMIEGDTVFSNLKYHDQYAIKSDEFSHNWKRSDSSIITDKKNNIYRRVSSITNYYEVVCKIYFDILLGEKTFTDGNGNSLSKSKQGFFLLNNDEYQLYLDIVDRNDEMDIVYNRSLRKQYGIQRENTKISIYDVQSVGMISFDIDENTIRLLYSFQ